MAERVVLQRGDHVAGEIERGTSAPLFLRLSGDSGGVGRLKV
jgi:hypothetical protein